MRRDIELALAAFVLLCVCVQNGAEAVMALQAGKHWYAAFMALACIGTGALSWRVWKAA